ncbi:MAG: ABC transporter substrate-binding protein [Veillonella tobetsuensis]|nr:ABC transporter substrate-binding protein [Veillonella tobetsuensis]
MKGLRKALLIGMTLGITVLSTVGCMNQDSASNNDVLKVGAISFAGTLEPTENYFSWAVVRYGVGETLIKYDDQMKAIPWLASSWKQSDDKLSWTFKINDKVKFSNGNPLTAEAVKSSLERTFAKSNRAKTFFNYTEITANGQELTIKTDKPYYNLPNLLGDPLFLIVDVTSEANGRNFAKEGPIGTGPYVVESFTKERAELKRNDNYWDGKVGFSRVEIPSINDANTRAMALQSGDVDMAIGIGPGEYGIFQNDKNFTIYEVASLRDVFVRMSQKGKLSNLNLRAALISAADRESYAKNLMKDTFVAGKAPLPPSIDYGFNQLRDSNAYNVERAKELLKREGYVDTNGDGIVDKNGENLVLNFYAYTSRPELPLYAEALQADYKKIGVDVQIKIVDYAVIDTLAQSGDYDMIISSVVTANTGQPVWFLKQYWGTGVEYNGSGFSSPRFDELIALGESGADPVIRRNAVINAQQLMLDESVALFLGYPKINIVGNKHIDGIKMTPSEYYMITKDLKRK